MELTATITNESTLTRSQVKTFGPRPIASYGIGAFITATVRYDDQCGNGRNSFSITGDITTPASRRRNDIEAGGCIHDEIAQHFPEISNFIKWHLCISDGPMHYIANTVYLAGDTDYNGMRKGEKRQLCNGSTKLPVWKRVARDKSGEVIDMAFTDWRGSVEMPTDTAAIAWEPVWKVGEGKERELDLARRAAAWPDATDEELTAPGLKERLEARLPDLLVKFRAAVESLGFIW